MRKVVDGRKSASRIRGVPPVYWNTDNLADIEARKEFRQAAPERQP